MPRPLLAIAALLLVVPGAAGSIPDSMYVSTAAGPGRFPLAVAGRPATLHASADDWPGVLRAARNLRSDLGRVTGTEPGLVTDGAAPVGRTVLVGTLGRSPLIDGLAASGRLDTTGLEGRWESFVIQTVDDPLPGLGSALVVAGSDKRGTIYGLYDLAGQIGVSPWTWWADVPVPTRPDLYVLPGRHASGEPAVRYRGIFLNDENPALLGWVNETFGGFNHAFYGKVFDLILRLKGNYLWPAMWGKAFSDDDPENPKLADEVGVVMGTSHHEPLARAHVEWERHGHGPWNYETNPDTLRAFWRKGVERMDGYENIVTVGMRGDGDEPMTQGTAIALLERIVADQRAILEDVTGRDPSTIPQLWALYKEVQDYYDQGMRVPDDVTLLFSDDNWGNIRRLPDPNAPAREGGYGIYYHFDYVGGPRNYKWINTNQIERVWEQMHLAWRHGADRIWIVNVGDLKPMEFPISFFLDYAWDPSAWPADRLPEYTRSWAEQQFGPGHAGEIAHLLSEYTRFNSRRKPELLSPDTYSLVDYREAERVVDEYDVLSAEARRVGEALPDAYRDAYFQLVLYPVEASANLNDLYVTVARNRLYAQQGRAATNRVAERARRLFDVDAELTRRYHEDVAGGRWNHMMDQTHIGYTYWQEPPENSMPDVREIDVPEAASMAVSVEGSPSAWPGTEAEAVLPEMSPFGPESRYVEVFNRGSRPFLVRVEPAEDWILVPRDPVQIDDQLRIGIGVDWSRAPVGRHRVPVGITGSEGTRIEVAVDVFRPGIEPRGFVESDGVVSIEAVHFDRTFGAGDVEWLVVPGLGRTLSSVTPVPVTAPSVVPGGSSPRLEYRFTVFEPGDVDVHALVSPTLDHLATGGLRYAVSIDDAEPVVVNIHGSASNRDWEAWVSDNVNETVSTHSIASAGVHTLRFWMADPGVVLQKIVVDAGGLRPSYLGPPESRRAD